MNYLDGINDVESFMQDRLPPYVVKCFLAAGFDTPEVITSMDTSENPGNSIKIIESFIEKYYSGHKDFYPTSIAPTAAQPFIFPPGHRLRISNFVAEVKRKLRGKLELIESSSKRKLTNSSKPLSKKMKALVDSDSDLECTDTIVSVSKQVRACIAKWVRSQSCIMLKNLKENKHFTVVVTNTPKSDILSVSVRCDACNTRIQLSKKKKIYPISNWTRHMKACQKLHKKEGRQQETLATFLSPEPATSSSGNISDTSSPLTDVPLPDLESVISNDSLLSEVEDISPHEQSEVSGGHNVPSLETALETRSRSHAFQTASSSLCTETAERGASSAVIDWSRAARNKKKLEHIGHTDSQTHITDYYPILEDIERLTLKNKKLSFLLQQEATKEEPSKLSLTMVLKQIVSNAERNAERLPAGRRHSEVVKKFATSLFIYAGASAYSFLQQNLRHALPSMRTIQRSVYSEYKTMNEGEFRFDELVVHLSQHKAPKVITVGEDATRVIARVQYDCETNRCVGFVLPLNELGLPRVDSFLALSFEGIEGMFSDNLIAKYAYVYMAQPLCDKAPSFCLACFGINNKFTAKEVLLRWQHILKECKKRGIIVLSVGGDGDSRLMKAMRSCINLFATRDESLSRFFPTPSLKFSEIPLEWKSWFLIDPCTVACVQDTVHIAVKLKSRLVKPSSLLPMGEYVAGIHHLRMLQASFGKDEHGLRERDIDHKDKQNFSAVMNIIRASPFLNNIPDAQATKQYVEVIQCVVDAYLDKDLDPLVRIEKIWYALIFLRYWRQWIILHPLYTLQRNFITQNAYLCIELNAHSILTFLMTIRDHFDSDASYFLPWLLGSQCCEKIFRSARSMTSTFSTIINFGMLGLLQRLHRLQIQSRLQAQSEQTGIVYPQILRHKSEIGKSKHNKPPLVCLSNIQICEAIIRANAMAKARVESLGMVDLLKKHKVWSTIPASADVQSDQNDSYSDTDDEENVESIESPSGDLISSIVQETSTECPLDIETDIRTLKDGKMINSEMELKLSSLQRSLPQFKKVNSESIPMYEISGSNGDISFTPFVKVTLCNGMQVFIRKTTVVWLFQEGERVSSDRLFRVRASQPFSSETTKCEQTDRERSKHVVRADVKLGEICAFMQGDNWCIGKLLQFSKYKNKTISGRQYKASSVAVSKDDVGVLCSWFSLLKGSTSVFQICASKSTVHTYIPISCYLCSICTGDCLQVVKTSSYQSKSLMHSTSSYKKMATAQQILLSEECQAFIADCLKSKKLDEIVHHSTVDLDFEESRQQKSQQINVTCSKSTSAEPPKKLDENVHHIRVDLDSEESDGQQKSQPSATKWIMIGNTILYEPDRTGLLDEEEWINDNHVAVSQILLKQQFPQLGGLDFTLKQETRLKPLLPNSLQVIHLDNNHWAAASTVNCKTEDIILYDSIYCSVNSKTKLLLARLVNTSKPAFSVQVANVTKQSGSSACGLFAIAYITDIAFGRNPEQHVFKQSEMRGHLYKCIEQQKMDPFPTSRGKRVAIHKPVQVEVHCYCRCPDYGVKMVLCNGVCGEHFHVKCIESAVQSKVQSSRKWYCKNCVI